MSRCFFFNKKALLLTVFVNTSASVFFAFDRSNILWLTAEDHSAYWLGSFGNKNAHTLNIDALAERGIRYTNFFAIDTLVGLREESKITDEHLQVIKDKLTAIKPTNRSIGLVAQAADTLLKMRK